MVKNYSRKEILTLTMNKSKFLTLVGASLVVFALIAFWLADKFLPYQLSEIIINPGGWLLNIVWGVVIGASTGFVAWWIVLRAFMTPVRDFFSNLFQGLKLNFWEILFISLCAGIGEELLFRGVIQYWLGITWTALLFVIIHGYLNPANWRLSVFGVFMVLAVMGFGYATNEIGLLTAIIAHIIVDVILLIKLGQSSTSQVDIPPE